MTCKTCAERRQAVMKAWQEGQIAKAVAELAGGAVDMVTKAVKGKDDPKDG